MPEPDRLIRTFLALPVAGALSWALPAAAQSPEQRLKSVEKQIDQSHSRAQQLEHEAEKLANELNGLRNDSVAAAAAAQEHEAALSALETRLAALGAEEAAKSAALARQRAEQAALLMALARLARNPPEGLILAPGEPVDALRSGLLLGAAIPPIEAKARALRQELDDLARVKRDIAEAQTRHRAERQALEQEEAQLATFIARKSALEREARQGAAESGQKELQLAAQAADLKQLIERLSAERRARDEEARRAQEAAARLPRPGSPPAAQGEVTAPPPVTLDPSKPRVIRPFASARGAMLFPASGHVIRRFGENDEFGMASKGLSLETRPGAQVVAPFDGRVLFAGPFRGYGQILIIEHGDGYHSLLAGLDRVEGTAGQWVVAGEPVGVMPKDGAKPPHLYLELRHDGQPINPLPWLATHDEKVSG